MRDVTSQTLKIGALAVTGTTPPTIRFYEEIGLVPAAIRQTGGALVSVIQDSSRRYTEVREGALPRPSRRRRTGPRVHGASEGPRSRT